MRFTVKLLHRDETSTPRGEMAAYADQGGEVEGVEEAGSSCYPRGHTYTYTILIQPTYVPVYAQQVVYVRLVIISTYGTCSRFLIAELHHDELFVSPSEYLGSYILYQLGWQ